MAATTQNACRNNQQLKVKSPGIHTNIVRVSRVCDSGGKSVLTAYSPRSSSLRHKGASKTIAYHVQMSLSGLSERAEQCLYPLNDVLKVSMMRQGGVLL